MEILLKNNESLLKRRENEDARKYAYRILKKSIMELVLPPTLKLNELEISNTLSLSRTPVHDTITKLSRDRLVDLVPKKGAYVTGFDQEYFAQSIWMQATFGSTVIQNILSKDLSKKEWIPLTEKLDALEQCISEGRYEKVTAAMLDYYHQLYVLSGDMELIWDALVKFSSDFQRILYLATSTNRDVSYELYTDLRNLTKFLIRRHSEQAYMLFDQHLSKILMLLEPIRKHKPDYITTLKS